MCLQLGIIEEGLQLKLEIQSIKDQFLSLMNNFNQFDKQPTAVMTKPPTVAPATTTTANSTSPKGLSSARARVRALYEARKARLRSKRAAKDGDIQQSPAKLRKLNSEDDKENSPVVSTKSSTARHRGVLRKLLTPIKEEKPITGVLEDRYPLRCTPVRRRSMPVHGKKIDGEYVILKTPIKGGPDCGDYVTLSPPSKCNAGNDTSIWGEDSIADVSHRSDATAELSSKEYSPERHGGCVDVTEPMVSPVRYASSDTISELYTTRSLKDVSQISQISLTSVREQVSSCNLSGAFHSTFNYPLHSTMNYPLSSTINFEDELASSGKKQQATPPTPMVLSIPSELRPVSSGSSSTSSDDKPHRQSTRRCRSQRCRSRVSSNKPQKVELCKEHGLHPNMGGPCIFQNDNSITLLDSSPDEQGGRQAPVDTDCDSSYLSECVDDVHIGQADDITATYDSRSGRMRMLKRQTGQIALKNARNVNDPIGLSESDFLFDVTQKNMSLHATCASIPDLDGLSGDESTLQNTLKQDSCSEKKVISPNSTLISLDRRPLSVSTTTDESPESNNGALQVPVNSPNVTDSGGSSSRPTTDNYDYVDSNTVQQFVQVTKAQSSPELMPPPPPLPPRQSKSRSRHSSTSRSQTQSGGSSHGHSDSGRSQRHHHYASVTQVQDKHRSQDVYCTRSQDSDINLRRRHSTHTPQDSKSVRSVRSLRRQARLHAQDMAGVSAGADSGFSTQRSRRVAPKPDPEPIVSGMGKHFIISDNAGATRTVVQHEAVGRNLQQDRKKAIVKKLKRFNSSFRKVSSMGDLKIETLGHFWATLD